MTFAWHWQEKYETANPEEASRRQLNKVEKEITFEQWMQAKLKETLEKKKKNKMIEVLTISTTKSEEDKRIANEKAFATWAQKKKAESSKQLKKKQTQDDQHLHLPKTFSISSSALSQAKPKQLKKCNSSPGPLIASAAKVLSSNKESLKSQQAFATWLKRKKKEDRIKKQLKKVDEKQKEQAKNLLHDQAFKKKSIVCAYSKNRSSTKRIIL